MNLLDVVQRQAVPEPWAEGEKIPWHDPDFSRRMLKEHLSQAHDAASRRFVRIDRSVEWIHTHVLGETPTRVLDLGCGPGLYTSRLAKLGHTCVGIDYGPASIAYAREQASREELACEYVEGDIRTTDYGGGSEASAAYGLVMQIYGELNVFRPQEARRILEKAYDALEPGGKVLLEPHTYDGVRALGEGPRTWYTQKSGLFSERPHLVLHEPFWHEGQAVAVERYYVVDVETAEITRHAASTQAYTRAQYQELLTTCGYEAVTFYPSLEGDEGVEDGILMGIVAEKGT
jgi:SAM-dependent methyltransferase